MITESQIQSQLLAARSAGTLPYFGASAKKYGFPASLLLAQASRESGIGSDAYYLAHNRTGSDGKSVGIMQINVSAHPDAANISISDDRKMIDKAASYLRDYLNRFNNMDAALDAYNAGENAVQTALQSGLPTDHVTTGGNYGEDILGRMGLINQILQSSPVLTQALAAPVTPASHSYIWVGAGLFFVVGTLYLIETQHGY